MEDIMKKFRIISALTATVMMLALAGCCGGGTTTTTVEKPTYNTTVGEQMIDLQKAYESGAISEAEYKKAKENILKGIDK
jgi:PBP1b-binding outer membrane lipoprotein LpoB